MPGRVVGAICPPVMPKLALLMKITRDVLAAGRGVHDLAHADGGHVAVALVGEDHTVRQNALDAGRHGRRASVRCFHKVGVKVVVGEYGAAHRRDADGPVQHAHFLQHLGHQSCATPCVQPGQ